ncbi:VWA domain-containing protein [Streptomyces yaanensis]|uniref:VWA domain-containing protein n=1 Tax=Streptomyces yaanensis TaxID=1142239 RepID=A0ABV7S9A2_9ACTN|nr:VWA domain-containing protein [Streptomyces sp. CGMCC 4.7035]WNB96661.1 VWA domain-containing protein [Streptomyces sp. CGMCC 4.7035]
MGILTLLRSAFGRSRKGRTAEGEPSRETATTEPTPTEAQPTQTPQATAAEPAEPTTSAEIPAQSSAPDEHELVAAAFDHVTVPRQVTPETEATAPAPEPTVTPEPEAVATEAEPTVTPEPVGTEPEPEATEPEPTVAETPEPEAEVTPEPEAVAEVAPEAEAEVTPEPEAVVEIAPEPEPEAEAEVTPEPEAAVEVAPEATVEVTPEATVEVAPEATVEVAPEATVKPEPEAQPEAEPQPEAEVEPEPEPEPAAEVTPEPVTEEAPEPVAEEAQKPVAEEIQEPVTEVTPEPEAEEAQEPEAEVAPEPVAEEPQEPVAEETQEPEPLTAEEPVAAQADAPAAADGEEAPQESPAPDDEIRTGGAGGNDPAEGEAEATQPGTLPSGLATAYNAAATVLEKHDLTGTRAKVYLVLDRSASMRPYYKDGSAQALGEQALALAAHLDPEATVPVVFFSTELDGTGELTLTDHENKIDDLHAGLGRMGRTSYHAAVEAVIAHHEKSQDPALPALVIFQTDGAPDAKTPATQSLTDAAKNHAGLFFSFVAFGDPENKAFDYLRKLKTDNTSHFMAGETPRELTDTEVYEGVLASWRP